MASRRYDPDRLARAELLPPPAEGTTVKWTLGQRSHIDVTDGCWYWTITIDRDGYGHTTNWRLAHRVAYEYWVGPIPDGHHVDHVCHNADLGCTDGAACMHRRCVRPDHLKARVALENLGDQYPTRKTHCKHGHEFTSGNTRQRRRTDTSRARECRTCANAPRGAHKRQRPQAANCLPRGKVEYSQLKATDEQTVEVPLRSGHIALVDAADWPLVSKYKWYLRVDRDHWMYARGIRRVDGKTEWVVMHRLIMQPERGQAIRHRNRHGLDNRRANLDFSWRTKANGPAHAS